MFNVDTRTTLTLARLHQDDLTASFPRRRRMFRPDPSRSAAGSPGLADAGTLSTSSPFQPQPAARGV